MPNHNEYVDTRKRRDMVKVNTIELAAEVRDQQVSMKELCRVCEISESTYHRIMGHSEVSFDTVQRIANTLKRDIYSLVEVPTENGPGAQHKHNEQSNDVSIISVKRSDSAEFDQAMCLIDSRFGDEVLSHRQFAAVIEGPSDRWLSNLIVAKKGRDVVATMLIDYDRLNKRAYLSYAARERDPHNLRYRWGRSLAEHIGKLMSAGPLSDCEMLCLEVEFTPQNKEYTLALLRLYDDLMSNVRQSGWNFRIADVPGYFMPHQTYRPDSRIGGEWSAALALITRQSNSSMPQEQLIPVVRWLWDELYVYRYGDAGDDRKTYAAYIENCVKRVTKKLPASVPLLRYAAFRALSPAIVKNSKKLGGLI